MPHQELPQESPEENDPSLGVHKEIVEEWEAAKAAYQKVGRAEFAKLKKKLKPKSNNNSPKAQTDMFEDVA